MELEMSEVSHRKNESSELLQLVSFKIGNEEFGVDILKVQEINKMVPITKVPNSPPFVEGVINLRGKVIPIIDLRTRLGMVKIEQNKDTRIIVVDVESKIIGFIVDSVSEVLRVPASITEAPPEIVSGVDSEFIKSVGKLEDRLLILIDLNKILSVNEKKEITNLSN
jgi:purine-binding chemotaxis protein CheW